MPTNIAVDIPLIDWLQVTSFSGHLYDRGVEYWKRSAADVQDGAKVLQYVGSRASFNDGTFFVGSALMGHRPNNMVVVSSSLADVLFMEFTRHMNQINIPRLDVQITVKKPHWYHQKATQIELDEAGKLSGMAMSHSNGIELRTLYIGSKESDQFARVYEKLTHDNEKLIRLECVVKDKRAWSLARMIRNDKDNRTSILAGYLLKRVFGAKSKSVITLFERKLRGYTDKTHTARIERVTNSTDRTIDWLMSSCVPSIGRVLNDHDSDRKIEIYRVLRKLVEEFEYNYLPD
jgi:hypothetical protein